MTAYTLFKSLLKSRAFPLLGIIYGIVYCVIFGLFSAPVLAQTDDQGARRTAQVYAFDLPADTLAKTLIEFAVQSETPVVVPFKLIESYRSSPVVGTFSLAFALEKILWRTPFTFAMDDAKHPQIRIVLKAAAVAQALPPPSAAASNATEEVIVTGMRASLLHSVDVKRYASGIVDAITAEDAGKFPDSNLAESVQRIPGASISRNNGEGSKVTVRGFTENYNLVTFNGRSLPGVSAPVNSIADSRAFEFSNLASENIRRVDIYKTSRADLTAGGIGATIDIKSHKPLDSAALPNFFSVTGVSDSSNRSGRDVTPEMAGFISWTDSTKWGLSLSASWQERDSGRADAYVERWHTSPWLNPGEPGALAKHALPCETVNGDPSTDQCFRFDNAPDAGQLFAVPSNLRYALIDSSRARLNSHLMVQYRPWDNITATLDYALFKNTITTRADEMALRLTGNRSYLLFDDEVVKTPVVSVETLFDDEGQATSSDLGFAYQEQKQINATESLGLNIQFELTDSVALHLDAHHSVSASGPGSSKMGGWASVNFGANVVGTQEVDWRGDLPVVNIKVNDDLLLEHGSNDGVFDARDVGTQVAFADYSHQRNDVSQIKLDAIFDGDASSLRLGLDLSAMGNRTRFSHTPFVLGDWGINDPSLVPDAFFTERNFAEEFRDFDIAGFYPKGFVADGPNLIAWAENTYDQSFSNGFRYSDNWSVDRLIEENTAAFYGQFNGRFDVLAWPAEVTTGLRYVYTEVDAYAIVNAPSEMVWNDNGDFNPVYLGEKVLEQGGNHYATVLPNLDLTLLPSESFTARLSLSQSMARPEYLQLSPEISGLSVGGITEPGQIKAVASAGNPALEALKSNNLDVSVEWYMAPASYLSVGYYLKKINNFVGTETRVQPVFGLRDASAGPRAIAARQAIAGTEDFDGNITETELFNQIVATENNDFNPEGADNTYYGNKYDIHPVAADPFYQFATLMPVNNKKAKIWGFEYAGQYFFGQSGLGLQANYTTVNGDIGFEIDAVPSATQFALVGLSDTFNLVGIYEHGGYQARLAYNWRARYLDAIDVEPRFVESYAQWDFMTSYDLRPNFTVQLEGMNITGENSRSHGRTASQLLRLEQLGARYQLSLRYQY